MLIPIAPVQGSTYTSVTGINDSNIIVGSYGTADGAQHGFFGSLDGQYTSFDAGRLWTQSGDINNAGYIVGATVKGAFERYPDGSIHILKFEHAPLVGEAYGINGKGVFVGTGFDNDGGRHAFYAKSAKYKGEVEIPGQSGVEPRGINDAEIGRASWRERV